jgi:hypothetical protein
VVFAACHIDERQSDEIALGDTPYRQLSASWI